MTWVFDRVYDGRRDKTVALLYHPQIKGGEHPDCLCNSKAELKAEGLVVFLGAEYATLDEAKRAAWKERESFAEDLD